MRRHALIAVIAAAWCIATGTDVLGATQVTGRVTDANTGDRVDKCAIVVRVDGEPPDGKRASTGSDGTYVIDLDALFGPSAAPGHIVEIEYTKTDFSPFCRCFQLPVVNPVDVPLVPTKGVTAFDPDLKKQLDNHRSAEGRTVYLLQYDVPSGTESLTSGKLTLSLANSLMLGINTQLASLAGGSVTQKTVSVDTLIYWVNMGNTARAAAIGKNLNALAMLDGSAATEAAGSGIQLTSLFQTIADVSTSTSFSTKLVGNLLDANAVNKQMGEDWSALGVLAVIERDLGEARSSKDNAKLCDVLQLVKAQLGDMRRNRSPAGNVVITRLEKIKKEIGEPCK